MKSMYRRAASVWIALTLLVIVGAAFAAPPSDSAPLAEDLPRLLVTFRLQSDVDPWQLIGTRVYASSSKWPVSLHQRREARAFAHEYQLNLVKDWPIKTLGLYCVVYQAPSSQDLDHLLARLRDDATVETAEPMQSYQLLSRAVGDDPLFAMQYGEHVGDINKLHALVSGKDVRVGLIDSHVDATHPELDGQIRREYSFIDLPVRRSGVHGTAMAGIIAARKNNGAGIVGVAPSAGLYTYEACGRRGGSDICQSFALAQALEQEIEDQVAVINLSLSGPEDALLHRLISFAYQAGITLVAARDPEQRDGGFPAKLNEVQGAGADLLTPLWFASGERFSIQAGGGYQVFYGNSVSAAGISGIAALLRQAVPGQDTRPVLQQILSGACEAGSLKAAELFLHTLNKTHCTVRQLARADQDRSDVP